jgi:hypothetical protein
MRNVQKIIDTRGGLEALKRKSIRLEVPGFMWLVIEHIGTGPRGGELVSVAHYGELNGDPMRDPEIVFEVAGGQWHPVSIQQDYLGAACKDIDARKTRMAAPVSFSRLFGGTFNSLRG